MTASPPWPLRSLPQTGANIRSSRNCSNLHSSATAPPTNIRPLPQVWNRIIKSVVILPLEYKYIYSCNDTARTRCCERNYNNHNAVSISLLPMIAPARPAADEMSCHTRHLHCNHRSHKPVFAMPIHKIMKLMTRSSAKRTSFMVDEFHKLLADFE